MSFGDRSDPERERAALALLRSARELRGLSPGQILRIEGSLGSPAKPERRAVKRLAAATLAVAVTAAGTLAVAEVGLWRLPLVGSLFSASRSASGDESRHLLPTAMPAAERAANPSPHVTRAESPSLSSFSTAPTNAADLPVRRKAAVSPPPRPGVEPSRTATAAHPPIQTAALENRRDEDPILAESRSLAAAVGKWHRDHDPGAALALLDGHERRFAAAGRFQPEVGVLRAEILLHEGREREGLRLLDSISLGGLPRARELLTVRGELRMKYGRCQEGRGDLDTVLTDTTDRFAERAIRAIRLCP